MYKYLLAFVLFSSSAFASAVSPRQLEGPGDYSFGQQHVVGPVHTDVTSVGVVICKKFDKDKKIKNDRYAVILGHERKKDLWAFQAGGVESKHQHSAETASAELYEETGGFVKYSADYIKNLPYVCANQRQLYCLYNPDQDIKVKKITKHCQEACKKVDNNKLSRCYGEMDRATAVSVMELLRVAKLIRNGKLPQKGHYQLKDRKGNSLRMKGNYLRAIAARYDQMCAIFNQAFGVGIFN